MKCFIIMPISTPPELLPHYNNDRNHFNNVLNHLFIPAVKASNMEPIPPSTEASEIIHADIISKLDSAELVLCDISSLNANVFFELGVRTALNKPVCLVKDDNTPKIPFDTLPIQCETYRSDLTVMHHTDDLKKISEHLLKTQDRNPAANAMWKAFGISKTASSPEPSSIDEKLDFLIQLLKSNFVPHLNFIDEFSPHVVNTLKGACLDSLGEIALRTEESIKRLRGIGEKEIDEIRSVLANHGLSLGMKRPSLL